MGACASSEASSTASVEVKAAARLEKAKSKQVDEALERAQNNDQHSHKLLLLGAGESGKSTLFKQMNSIYGKGYNKEELESYIPIIHSNVITAMKTLLAQVEYHSRSGVTSNNRHYKTVIDGLCGDEPINSNISYALEQLWHDPAIESTYNARSQFQLSDSAAYFLRQINAISSPSYIPTFQDILHARVRTTGIVEEEFLIEDNRIKMFDVGGQRNERKKWIHCFEGVTAVLFVAALSEYDQSLYEDENINRMNEALNLFEDICNNRWFRKTAMILFLNKKDLFEEKLRTSPIDRSFPEYAGDNSYESGVKFFRHQFESRNRNDDKEIFTHVTCATDTDQMKHIFEDVKNIVVKQSLVDAGLY